MDLRDMQAVSSYLTWISIIVAETKIIKWRLLAFNKMNY